MPQIGLGLGLWQRLPSGLLAPAPGGQVGVPLSRTIGRPQAPAAVLARIGAGVTAPLSSTIGVPQVPADINPDPSSGITLEFAIVANTAEVNANHGSTTKTGISFGAADANRVLYGVFLGSAGIFGLNPPTFTLDGDAMTVDVVANYKNSANNDRVAIAVASIAQSAMTNPTATSGDVVISTSDGSWSGSKFILYRGVGYSATPHDTLTAQNTTPNSGAIDFPSNGILLAGVMDYLGSVGYTWSHGTEDFDDGMRFAGRGSIVHADGLTGGAGTTLTATVGAGGGEVCGLAAAAYAPI